MRINGLGSAAFRPNINDRNTTPAGAAQNSLAERGIIIVGGKDAQPAEDRGIIIVGGKPQPPAEEPKLNQEIKTRNGILFVGGKSIIR